MSPITVQRLYGGISDSSAGVSAPTAVDYDTVISFMREHLSRFSDDDLSRFLSLDGIEQIGELSHILKEEIKRRNIEYSPTHIERTYQAVPHAGNSSVKTSVQGSGVKVDTIKEKFKTPPKPNGSENKGESIITILLAVGIAVVVYLMF